MKITFEKGMKVTEILELFEEFILEESEEYPILKNNVSIDILLRNDIGQISPNNERKYCFGKAEYDKIVARERKYADERLQQEWESYTSDYHYQQLIKDIKADHNYIETAVESSRSPKNVENRKKLLLRHEKQLEDEKNKLHFLSKFIDFVKEEKVKYKYIEYERGILTKIMIFEMDETYIFDYFHEVIGESELRKVESDEI